MNNKIKVQICFSRSANLENVGTQLRELSKNENFEFYSCFLTRRHVEEKRFSLDIVEMLENTLGSRHVFMTERYETFAEVMANINSLREETANIVNRMYVLDSGTALGVAKEIELFTRAKVIMMP